MVEEAGLYTGLLQEGVSHGEPIAHQSTGAAQYHLGFSKNLNQNKDACIPPPAQLAMPCCSHPDTPPHCQAAAVAAPCSPQRPWRGEGLAPARILVQRGIKMCNQCQGQSAARDGGDSHHATPQHMCVLCSQEDDTWPMVPCSIPSTALAQKTSLCS